MTRSIGTPGASSPLSFCPRRWHRALVGLMFCRSVARSKLCATNPVTAQASRRRKIDGLFNSPSFPVGTRTKLAHLRILLSAASLAGACLVSATHPYNAIYHLHLSFPFPLSDVAVPTKIVRAISVLIKLKLSSFQTVGCSVITKSGAPSTSRYFHHSLHRSRLPAQENSSIASIDLDNIRL